MELNETPRQHDVLIVGGGLVGASLAIALEPLGLDVGLVEATASEAIPPVFDERNLSMAEATSNALTALGVWPLLGTAPAAIRRIQVSRQGDFGRLDLSAADYGRDAFGHVVVARDFGAALEERLAQARALTRYRPARFTATRVVGDAREVVLQGEQGPVTLRTRLLVGADGADSTVREAVGIHAQAHDYQQCLFVCRMRGQKPPDGTAYERLGDAGPTAVLPRADRHFGVIHGVAASEADSVAALDDSAFIAKVQSAFGWRVGRFLSAGPRSRYAARRVVASRLTAERVVVVGNAAQSLHPIGAQGFNLGLRDALILTECIAGHPSDAGCADVLARHAERRREDRERTLEFSDGLARFTANPASWLRPVRTAGLAALGALPWLQAQLVAGAMGYRGDVPQLCRRPA